MTHDHDVYVPDADWSEVDAHLVRLGKARGEHDYEVGRWLLAARRQDVHSLRGFATFGEYIERRLGYDPRTTSEKLRVAEALADLPLLREALRAGRRHWSAVRELARVAVAATEGAWLSATEMKTVREVERMVSGLHPGDPPDAPKDPALKTHPVRLEMSAELFVRFREATDRLRKEIDPRLTDEDAVAAMVDRVLGGSSDAGRAPSQVSLTICDHCGRTWQRSRGEMVEVEAHVGERACCDGEVIGTVPAPDAPCVAEAAAPPTHMGAPVGEARAQRTTSPRLWRLVFARAHGRCEVPGCRNHLWVDVHHLVPLALGGANHESNCALLCTRHHALHHRGLLIIEGTRASGLRFAHVGGMPYGAAPPLPGDAESPREALAALRALGVDAAPARALLSEAAREVGEGAPAEKLVLAAVRIRGRGLAVRHAAADAAHDRGSPRYGLARLEARATASRSRDHAVRAA